MIYRPRWQFSTVLGPRHVALMLSKPPFLNMPKAGCPYLTAISLCNSYTKLLRDVERNCWNPSGVDFLTRAWSTRSIVNIRIGRYTRTMISPGLLYYSTSERHFIVSTHLVPIRDRNATCPWPLCLRWRRFLFSRSHREYRTNPNEAKLVRKYEEWLYQETVCVLLILDIDEEGGGGQTLRMDVN
jgi:hypothetical protein